jgi:nucleoside-specific outer membrane channel protein Tsx
MAPARAQFATALRRFAPAASLPILLSGAIAPALAQEQAPDPAATAPATTEATPAPAPVADDKFFVFTDNSISYLPFGSGFRVDPSQQSTVSLEHAHASKIGDLFMFVDFTDFHDTPGGSQSSTWYGEFGPRLSLGKLTGKDFSHTFFKRSMFEIKDLLIAAQYERGEDPDVAEAVLLGIGLDLDVREAGILGGLGKFNYVQLNFYARSELTEGVRNGFHDAQITMVASRPFEIGQQKFLIDGYFDWVLGIGEEDWSYHINPQITWDAGNAFGHPGHLYVGAEIDWWWNKYQIPNSPGFDTNQQALSMLLKYHF